MPDRVASVWLEARAGRIHDPVAKLRYLRSESGRRHGIPRMAKHIAAVVLALGVVMMMPLSMMMRAKGLLSDSRYEVPLPVRLVPADSGAPLQKVWQVDRKDEYETYSNGLRIETRGVQVLEERTYMRFHRAKLENAAAETIAVGTHYTEETAPAGIVFHTTESDLAPFSEDYNRQLRRMAQGTLDYVRQKKAYHYLIDRFGRVYRVVEEASAANHAGWSAWADSQYAYVGLNSSFLAVSFEGQTLPEGTPVDGKAKENTAVTAAQLHSARILTDMLRYKYRIRAENCVTHAQVSVNPDNFGIGAHTDWGASFPFDRMGLPDNYQIPPPAMTLFGFSYDSTYLSVSEARLWQGLLLGQEQVRQAASARQMSVARYRARLQKQYQALSKLTEEK
ncbi:MAG: N-acetylmuramoyl-L-alanine amidase [Acidobacteria bacterium]|nr:N-acetylmuramoyl-L-alanine amidase [Acidobacteriota bacterium]